MSSFELTARKASRPYASPPPLKSTTHLAAALDRRAGDSVLSGAAQSAGKTAGAPLHASQEFFQQLQELRPPQGLRKVENH